MTGDPYPDCTGEYVEDGITAGKPYYVRTYDPYHLWWWAVAEKWCISLNIGNTTNCWASENDALIGRYEPLGTHLGNPVVENA